MKTFLEFILETNNIINESDQAELSKLRREIQTLQQRGKTVPAELHAKAAELAKQVNASARAGALLNRDKPQQPKSKNTYITGKPKTKKGGEISSVGTQSNVSRQRITNMRTGQDLGSAATPGMNVSGLHGDTSSRSQKGGRVPTRNIGQGYSSPERGNYNR